MLPNTKQGHVWGCRPNFLKQKPVRAELVEARRPPLFFLFVFASNDVVFG
jgi:hypothetical protein